MKKGFIIVLLSLLAIMMFPDSILAAENQLETKITTVSELEDAIKAQLVDGTLSEESKTDILKKTEEGILDVYICNKIEAAFTFAKTLDREIDMQIMPNGTAYAREVYYLGDGYILTMEFEDGKDILKDFISGNVAPISLQATNGETLWKDYGNRYFTAKVSVNVGVGAGTISLKNHYILSAQGIDENYGTASGTPTSGASYIKVGSVVITDSSARTVGASDVDMDANFKVISKSGIDVNISSRKLSTTIAYISHDYKLNRIQVKHTWNLS